MQSEPRPPTINKRFRGFLPVVIDVETGGFNAETDALLEIAAITLQMDESGQLYPDKTIATHVKPFEGANIEPKALEVNGIRPYSPLRIALDETEALEHIFKAVRKAVKSNRCSRAILVGHNAFFDLNFINAAAVRTGIKRNPFHPFSSFDTVSLCGLAYGQTVLARAAAAAGMSWESSEAHSAVYDATQTAKLFCKIINDWDRLNPEMHMLLYTEEIN